MSFELPILFSCARFYKSITNVKCDVEGFVGSRLNSFADLLFSNYLLQLAGTSYLFDWLKGILFVFIEGSIIISKVTWNELP